MRVATRVYYRLVATFAHVRPIYRSALWVERIVRFAISRFQPLSCSFLFFHNRTVSLHLDSISKWHLADPSSTSISSVTLMISASLRQTIRCSLNTWPSSLLFRNRVSLRSDFRVLQLEFRAIGSFGTHDSLNEPWTKEEISNISSWIFWPM